MNFDQEYTNYQLNRNLFRKLIRKFYLYYYRSLGVGKALDFGCGIGELLAILPKGSKGLEVNQASVIYCQKKGLDVDLYDPQIDHYCFDMIPKNTYNTFYMCEVLEHLDQPEMVLHKIFASCHQKGFKRIILVVPGKKGFALDPTHKFFIDKAFLEAHDFTNNFLWQLNSLIYFPINIRQIGDFFAYNQMIIIFDKKYEN